ncbi:MAG: 16S rRNA (cytosine(1402)-N(4))-methyltransferase RsmH [Planctomycetes bacterium]|nr:16S rRNA (cytosine(1402)-N(4))-methyltransferase RsmH [Planctomycetota bacterium]
MFRGQRSTPAGEHRPVLLAEVLSVLAPRPGAVVVDCTVGWAGHALELLQRVGPTGRLIGMDLDADNLPRARERLQAVGFPFTLHQGNFAGLPNFLAGEGLSAVDLVLADLGMSSMQVDDPGRGFSYVRDGPLDMRMDRSRGRTAGQLLQTISEPQLQQALQDYGDEPEAERIAAAIIAARQRGPLERTGDLARVIVEAMQPNPKEKWRLHPARQRWNLHPAARTFQALRILVNRELANLEQLLRILPIYLSPGGTAAIISFHSGEDRLVKTAFRAGKNAGVYDEVAPEPVRPAWAERTGNPRARSAKLRWARRNGLFVSPG